MTNKWSTTVTELLGVLRQALAAVVPAVEAVRIPWREGEAYDDWDNIAACLYDKIVVRPLEYSSEVVKGTILPKYDMIYPSYGDAFILVEGGGIPAGTLAAFVGFAAISPNFDGVKWVKVSPSGEVSDQKIGYLPYADCHFFLVRDTRERTKVHALTIEI